MQKVGSQDHQEFTLNDEAKGLANRIRTTAGARFEASRRHQKKLRTSNISIVVLSSYAILFSMAATFLEINDEYTKQALIILSIFMSSLIISFTLFEGSKRHESKADNFLKCSQNLHELMNEIFLNAKHGKPKIKDISSYQKKYDKILSNYAVNHSDIDLERFWSKTNAKKFKNKFLLKFLFQIKFFLNVWLLPILAFLSPLVLIGMMIGSRIVIGLYFSTFPEL